MNAMISADPAFLDWRASPSRDTLRRLLLACQDRVYSLCFQVLRQEQDAEDAAQTSLVEISRALLRIENPQAFRSWMYRVTLNNALSLRRERGRRKEREQRRAAMNPTAHATNELRDAVHDALAELEDDERALVVEHYFEKATLDDLGARRGVSGVAIWKRIDRAREKMKKSLAGAGLAVGLTQMNSVLEAAEFTPAPPGLTFEEALGRVGTAPKSALTFGLKWLMAVVAVIAIIQIVGPRLRPSILQRFNVTVTPPATPLPVRDAAPAATPEATTPFQEESPRVVDPEGHPIQGALVFPGRWFRLRGDDAFDLFRPQSIKDGVMTDAEGRYRLETKAPFITAWHDEFTPTTVGASEKTLRMKTRGTLKGRFVDAAGKGREGVEITLDKRGPKSTTDKEGRFQFEKVIAGFRGLILQDRRWIAVRIDPGETLNVDIGPGADVSLNLENHPKGSGVDLNGVLLGTGRTWSLVGVRGTTPSTELKGVIPGRYFYGEVRRGPRGWVDVSDQGAKVQFGTSTLLIESEDAVSFYLLPADCNEIIEVAIMKDGELKSGPGAPFRMEHLTEGEYEIKDRLGVTLKRFKVGPGETRVDLH